MLMLGMALKGRRRKKTRAALHECSMLRIALINARERVVRQDDGAFHVVSE